MWANRSFTHKNEQIAQKTDERIPNPGVQRAGYRIGVTGLVPTVLVSVAENTVGRPSGYIGGEAKNIIRLFGIQFLSHHHLSFQAGLFVVKPKSRGGFNCGGTIISQSHILTAGHCLIETIDGQNYVAQPEDVTVFVGSTQKTRGRQHAVELVKTHAQYDHPRSGITK